MIKQLILAIGTVALASLSYVFGFSWQGALPDNAWLGWFVDGLSSTASELLLPAIVLLLAWISASNRRQLKLTLLTVIPLLCLVAVGIKSSKAWFELPRPFALQLMYQGELPPDFYQHNEDERQVLISKALTTQQDVKPWLSKNWQEEIGYTFPSGHSFAAFFVATFFASLAFSTGNKRLAHLLLAWAVSIAYTRLLLQVHWPQDVLVGACLGSMSGYAGFHWRQRLDRLGTGKALRPK